MVPSCYIILCPCMCRQTGQGTSDEVRTRDLRRELEEKERDVRVKRGRDKPRSFTGEQWPSTPCGLCIYMYRHNSALCVIMRETTTTLA